MEPISGVDNGVKEKPTAEGEKLEVASFPSGQRVEADKITAEDAKRIRQFRVRIESNRPNSAKEIIAESDNPDLKFIAVETCINKFIVRPDFKAFITRLKKAIEDSEKERVKEIVTESAKTRISEILKDRSYLGVDNMDAPGIKSLMKTLNEEFGINEKELLQLSTQKAVVNILNSNHIGSALTAVELVVDGNRFDPIKIDGKDLYTEKIKEAAAACLIRCLKSCNYSCLEYIVSLITKLEGKIEDLSLDKDNLLKAVQAGMAQHIEDDNDKPEVRTAYEEGLKGLGIFSPDELPKLLSDLWEKAYSELEKIEMNK